MSQCSHPLEPYLGVSYPSAGSQPWGQLLLRGNCPSAAPSSVPPAQGWDGEWTQPTGVLFATIGECLCGSRRFVSALWVSVVLGAGGHGQNQRSLMFLFAFLPKSIADSSA